MLYFKVEIKTLPQNQSSLRMNNILLNKQLQLISHIFFILLTFYCDVLSETILSLCRPYSSSISVNARLSCDQI